MDSQKIVIVFAAGLFAIGVLSACNLGNRVTDQANQVDTATTAPEATTMSAPATSIPSVNNASVAKPTATRATTAKPTATTAPPMKPANAAPTPTVSPAQSNTKKQGDDVEQQINQLLNNLNNTDTVNDAGQ